MARTYHYLSNTSSAPTQAVCATPSGPAHIVPGVTLAAIVRTLALLLALSFPAIAQPTGAAAQDPSPDVLRIPFPQYDGGLTPYTFELGYPLLTLVYDTLMWRDQEGVPKPWLAQSVTRSNGGRRVTVRLRTGVRWHDDRPLTAADVAFTYRYIAQNYQPRFTPQLRDVASVRAQGRSTVVFDLRRPSLGFEDQPLSDVPIMPRHEWRDLPSGADAPAGLPVGSGPYRLASANRRRGYVLRANPEYFRGAPRVNEIRVPIIDDAERTYDALRARTVDMVPLSLAAPAAESLRSGGLTVRRGPFYAGTMLVLNLRRAPFNTLEARKTVSDAIDLDLILRRVAPAVAAEQGVIHPDSRWAAGARPDRPKPSAAGQRALDATKVGPRTASRAGSSTVHRTVCGTSTSSASSAHGCSSSPAPTSSIDVDPARRSSRASTPSSTR